MRKLTPLMFIHLILMLILCLSSAFSTIMFFGGFGPAVEGKCTTECLLNGILTSVVMVMMVMGVLYLLKGYRKNASGFYKAFLLLLVLLTFIVIIIDAIYAKMNVWIISKSILYVAKGLLLLCLALWKDLGKKKTLRLFCTVLAIDIAELILVVINIAGTGFDFSFVGVVAALIADGTIWLSVNGKYNDKKMRGSK